MFEIGQIILFQKGTNIFAIFPEAPLWLVPRSIPPINWSFVEVVLWKLIVLLPFSFPVNIVSGAKLKLGKFAIKLVGGGANIRNTDEFSLPYIQLIQLAIQVIIHHPTLSATLPLTPGGQLLQNRGPTVKWTHSRVQWRSPCLGALLYLARTFLVQTRAWLMSLV